LDVARSTFHANANKRVVCAWRNFGVPFAGTIERFKHLVAKLSRWRFVSVRYWFENMSSEQNYNNQVGKFGDSGSSQHMGVNRWVFTPGNWSATILSSA